MRSIRVEFFLLFAAGGLVLSSCSLGRVQPNDCENNTECRAAFGRGWTCSTESGLCEEAAIHPRCSSEPVGALENLSEHEDRIFFGSIFDGEDFELMVKSSRVPIRQVNDVDGLGGQLFGMIECTVTPNAQIDALDDEEATREVGLYLSDTLGLTTLIGPGTSPRVELAYNALADYGPLMISPSATSPSLTALDGLTSTPSEPGLLWRTAPPDTLQGAALVQEMLLVDDLRRLAIISKTGAYGNGLAEVVQGLFNGAITGADSERFPFDTITDLSQSIIEVANSDPPFDAVLFVASGADDNISFLNAAAENAGFEEMEIFLPDAARDTKIFKDAGTRAALFPQIRGTVPRTPSGLAYQNFRTQYLAQYNDGTNPDDFGFSAHAYDASWLGLVGAAWSHYQEGSISPIGSARGLRQISDSSVQESDMLDLGPTGWNSIKAHFEDGESINVVGASGSLEYDPETGETVAPLDVWVIQENPATENGYEFCVLYCMDLSPDPTSECEVGAISGPFPECGVTD